MIFLSLFVEIRNCRCLKVFSITFFVFGQGWYILGAKQYVKRYNKVDKGLHIREIHDGS